MITSREAISGILCISTNLWDCEEFIQHVIFCNSRENKTEEGKNWCSLLRFLVRSLPTREKDWKKWLQENVVSLVREWISLQN